MRTEHENAAYVAGLIDGEGHIGIIPTRGNFVPTVQVVLSKAPTLLESLKAKWGGKVYISAHETEVLAETRIWQVRTDAEVRRLIEAVTPHLRLKVEHAHQLIRFLDLRDSMKGGGSSPRVTWTEEGRERAARMRAHMQELNRRGPQPPSPGPCLARFVGGTLVSPQASLFDDLGWEPWSGPWPVSGSWDATGFYEQPTWVPPTDGNESSSLLGTPTSHPRTHSPRDVDHGVALANQIALLPTPMTADAEGGRNATNLRWEGSTAYRPSGSKASVSLQEAMALLPTPRTSDSTGAGEHGTGGQDLRTTISLLPTPTAGDSKASTNTTAGRSPGKTRHDGDTLTDAVRLRLGGRMRRQSTDGST